MLSMEQNQEVRILITITTRQTSSTPPALAKATLHYLLRSPHSAILFRKARKMRILQKAFLKCDVLLRGCLVAGIAAAAGTRSHKTGNQDVHFVAQFMQEGPVDGNPLWRFLPRRTVACVGVFDGHGPEGREAARIAAATAKNCIARGMLLGRRDLKEVLGAAMKEVAKVLDESAVSLYGGTTGSVVVMRGGKVVMAHVGDSAITLWAKNGKHQADGSLLKHKSQNHGLDVLEERLRVERAKGSIEGSYIADVSIQRGLAVTRSFGDISFRKYGCTTKADVVEMDIARGDTLVLASDGLWDDSRVSMENVGDLVKKYRKQPHRLASRLLRETEGVEQPWDDTTIICVTRT